MRSTSGIAGCPCGLEAGGQSVEISPLDGVADTPHELLIVEQIVNRCQPMPEYLVAAVEMLEIGAAEIPAGIALAFRIDRSRVLAVARIADPEHAATGEQM